MKKIQNYYLAKYIIKILLKKIKLIIKDIFIRLEKSVFII